MPGICSENLAKPLFIVASDRSLKSNLNPELVAILKETKYMIMLAKENLPKEALDLFARTKFFIDTNFNINLIVDW